MSLTPTQVVDKNGRLTTVHKRSGKPVSASKRLAGASPDKLVKSGKPKSKKKIDRVHEEEAPHIFVNSSLCQKMNSRFPHRAVNPGNTRIQWSTREVYEFAREGFTVGDGMIFNHYGATLDEAFNIAREFKNLGPDATAADMKLRPKEWVDVVLDADIDHHEVAKAIDNGMTYSVLDDLPHDVIPGYIKARGSRVFSSSMMLLPRIKEGTLKWEDVEQLGATRAAKYENVLFSHIMAQNRMPIEIHDVPFLEIKKIIIEAEGRNKKKGWIEDDVSSRLLAYRSIGEHALDVHMPSVTESLYEDAGYAVPEDNEIFIADALYCDEVIHQVRSDIDLISEVIQADGGRSAYQEVVEKGKYETPFQGEPVWRFAEIAKFRREGVTVEQCVESLAKGLSPVQAAGVYREGVSKSVSSGWL